MEHIRQEVWNKKEEDQKSVEPKKPAGELRTTLENGAPQSPRNKERARPMRVRRARKCEKPNIEGAELLFVTDKVRSRRRGSRRLRRIVWRERRRKGRKTLLQTTLLLTLSKA